MNVLASLTGALALTIASAASADGSPVIVHQSNAGKLDAQGWTRANVTVGGISVDMPCLYTDMNIVDSDNTDQQEHYVNSGSVLICTGPRLTGMAILSSYNTGAKGADFYFNQKLQSAAKNAKVDSSPYQGWKAYRSVSTKDGHCVWSMSVRYKDRMVTLTLSGDVADCETLRRDADRMFNSLVLPA